MVYLTVNFTAISFCINYTLEFEYLHLCYFWLFNLQIQRDVAAILQPYFTSTGLVIKALEHASKMEHIMDFTRLRCLGSLFSMMHQACRNVALYNNNHPDFPMPVDQLEKYMQVSSFKTEYRNDSFVSAAEPMMNSCDLFFLTL